MEDGHHGKWTHWSRSDGQSPETHFLTALRDCPFCYPARVEVRNTPPQLPVVSRESTVLLEDLCLALRDVSVFNGHLPNGEVIVEKIDNVKAIFSELSRRGVAIESAVQELSAKTNRQLGDLLADCLGYPARIPFDKGLDGVRERFRCQLCRGAEHPEETLVWICDGCLDRTIAAIENRTPLPGLFLYRTYSESRRCCHADSDTVMATILWTDEGWFDAGRCSECFLDEKRKRQA